MADPLCLRTDDCRKTTVHLKFQQLISNCAILDSEIFRRKDSENPKMKFRLIIDRNTEEEVVATVHDRSVLTDQLEQLVLKYVPAGQITAYTEDDIKLLDIEKIECITIMDGRTWAVDESGQKYRLKHRLYELEEMLPEYFIRINKSALANEKRIDRFSASFSGAVDVVFKCGYREYVSRRCFAEIRRRFEG